mgnify:CR=1 FL=1
MKRVYRVTIESDSDTASEHVTVFRPNVIEATRAGLRVFRKQKTLIGHVRVTKVEEIAVIDE